jgi:TIR domain
LGQNMPIEGITSPEDQSDFYYWAFIAYSHHDVEVAQWLHTELEAYRLPNSMVGRLVAKQTIPKRLFPVFRDIEELPGASNLTSKISEALEKSHALIVLCSPYSALSPWVDEEVRRFKLMGKADRIFPVIIDGEPYASQKPDARAPECFPPALRLSKPQKGSKVAQRAQPLAVDLRPTDCDKEQAKLRLVAAILGVGFNDLRRREDDRKRRARWAWIGGAALLLPCIVAGYVAFADSGGNIPGGQFLRQRLDRYELSIFRSFPDDDAVRISVTASRAALKERLLQGVAAGTLSATERYSAWESAQVAASIYRDPEATVAEISSLVPMMDFLFRSDVLVSAGGVQMGWSASPAYGYPQAEPTLWVIMALTAALNRGNPLPAPLRQRYVGYLHIAQSAADLFYPLTGGAWNTVEQQKQPNSHSVYATTLALHTLVQTRLAQQCWANDCSRLDFLIQQTADWLVRAFESGDGVSGWRRRLDDDKPPDEALSLMTFGVLAGARLAIGVDLPKDIRQFAIKAMTAMSSRSYTSNAPDIRYEISFTDHLGKVHQNEITTVRVLWFAWVVEALENWLRLAVKDNEPNEVIQALRRSRAHFLVDESKSMLADVLNPRGPHFVASEVYYSLNSVRRFQN